LSPIEQLDVLVLIGNQVAINILNGEDFQSDNLIVEYSHPLQDIFSLIEQYKLRPILIKQIKNFINGNTHNDVIPDIVVFMHKIFLSGIKFNEVRLILLDEYLARQVFWMKKNEVNLSDSNQTSVLKNRFNASIVSNQLYVFWLSMAKGFINQETQTQLNNNYGLSENETINKFKAEIKGKLVNY